MNTAAIEQSLREAYRELLDNFVDPADATRDEQGDDWTVLGGGLLGGRPNGGRAGFRDETELALAREQCRLLAELNEFAINGHENRISYIVGTGHKYSVVPAQGSETDAALAAAAQQVLDEFRREVDWSARQQEIVRRMDRDGECFLRFFPSHDGRLRLRFVEPWQVSTPAEQAGDPAAAFGILTEPDDVETVIGYTVDGRFVEAAQIQHRKANVDANVRRGIPLFWPVRDNLRRAEKLLRNMAAVADIQTAIALIRKHAATSRSAAESFRSSLADAAWTTPGRSRYFQRFRPGAVIDAAAGIEYEFPTKGLDSSNYVLVLQAVLRAVASRLVMPEFMLTSDASNANYSSTLVAEGPAVKMFERCQATLVRDDLAVMRRVLAAAARAGRLPADVETLLEIQVGLPNVQVRNRLEEAQLHKLLIELGLLSPQTASAQSGLDYQQEQANRLVHGAAETPL